MSTSAGSGLDAATALDPLGAVDPGADDPSRTRPRGITALVVTPVLLAAAGVALALFVSGAEKDSAETSALDWSTKLEPQLRQHLVLTFWSTLLVLLVAVPLGILLTRPFMRRGRPESRRFLGLVNPTVLALAQVGQALPAYGLFVLVLGWRGQGTGSAVLALVIFATLPVLLNTMVGLDQVDPAIIEAGRGMGMSRLAVLLRIELPLAVPVILAGVRTALVINVGMATLAFFIGAGGLGITINSGLKLSRDLITFTGAAMAALVALVVDWLAAVAERVLRPKGV